MSIPKIVVVGGLVIDIVFDVPKWPKIREAVQAKSFTFTPGGKGLNQAVAASRLGAKVYIISAVGPDPLGDQLIRKLKQEGIDEQFVYRRKTDHSAVTCVIVEKGEPGFIGTRNSVDPKSAPDQISSADVRKAQSFIKNADAVLATFEVPFEAIQTAFEIAKENNVHTILNPAPPDRVPPEIFRLTDYIIPNLWEASVICGDQISGSNEGALAVKLQRRGARNVIVTKGDLGCVLAAEGAPDTKSHEAIKVEIIDTTGASDAFCAAIAVGVAENLNIDVAIRQALGAGALACTKTGALESMPTRKQLNNFLKQKRLNQ